MDDIHTDLSPDGLTTAVEANMAAFFGQTMKAWSRAEAYYGTDMAWVFTGIPLAIFNSTVQVRLNPEATDAAIEASIARSQAHNVPNLWWIGPGTQPDDLAERLLSHGYSGPGETPGMAIDLATLERELTMPLGITIEQVTDQSTLDEYTAVLGAGFGITESASMAFNDCFRALGLNEEQPLRHYLARLDGKPVATCALFLGAGVAGIYNVATQEDARGRGIGTAITAYPLHKAWEMGYQIGILKSSEMGFNVYQRLGFEQIVTFRTYVWKPAEIDS